MKTKSRNKSNLAPRSIQSERKNDSSINIGRTKKNAKRKQGSINHIYIKAEN